jgi:hypothetical protein
VVIRVYKRSLPLLRVLDSLNRHPRRGAMASA